MKRRKSDVFCCIEFRGPQGLEYDRVLGHDTVFLQRIPKELCYFCILASIYYFMDQGTYIANGLTNEATLGSGFSSN